MGEQSNIEWTDATWNPWYGCHKVSQGCKNCYMFRDAPRFGRDPNTVVRSKTTFKDPLKWKEPRRIFTCSWSDFFIEEADAWRDEAFAIMALTPHHTYQVLTKRPDRMLEYMQRFVSHSSHLGDRSVWASKMATWACDQGIRKYERIGGGLRSDHVYEEILLAFASDGSLPNVWLGVSVEDQKTADERIPLLLQTPAAVRWLSMEPLLGPVDLTNVFDSEFEVIYDVLTGTRWTSPRSEGEETAAVDWVVVGGESGGQAARMTDPDWLRTLRDQCLSVCKDCGAEGAGYARSTGPGFKDEVSHWASCRRPAFFFKQWGEYAPLPGTINGLYRIGKKAAGRTLDGRTWDEYPSVK